MVPIMFRKLILVLAVI